MAQGLDQSGSADADKMPGLVETPVRFQLGDQVGHGMMKVAFWSQFDRHM